MKRKLAGRSKRRRLPNKTIQLSNVYQGTGLGQRPPVSRIMYANREPEVPVYTGSFSIQFSVDKLYSFDTPWNFSFSASEKLSRNQILANFIRIRLDTFAIIRDPSYTGGFIPLYVFTNLGVSDTNEYSALLTSDLSGNALGNVGMVRYNAGHNQFKMQLFFDADRTLQPTISDGITDFILRFSFEAYQNPIKVL